MFDALDANPIFTNGVKSLEITQQLRHLPTGCEVSYGFADSPFGVAVIGLYDGALISLGFCSAQAEEKSGFTHPGYTQAAAFSQMSDRFKGALFVESPKLAAQWAERIFDSEAATIPLKLVGTDFQTRVWCALMGVAWGDKTAYGAIANIIDKPKASRAVGTAIGANPIAWLIPCHRILSASGALHNYHWGLACKQHMLAFEAENQRAPT